MMKRQFRSIELPGDDEQTLQLSDHPEWLPVAAQSSQKLLIPIPRPFGVAGEGLPSSWQSSEAQDQQGRRNALMAQDTMIMPSMRRIVSPFKHKLVCWLPMPAQMLLLWLLERARDPDPERYYATRQGSLTARMGILGWLPLLTLTSSLGMLIIASGFANSRNSGTGLETFFFSALLLIFTPVMVRLLVPSTPRAERIGLVCMVGICCYLIKVMSSPLYFSFFDEFLHWRTVNDIASTGHLFTENALLPVSPYYPGLEIVTNALSTLSGLNTFTSGLIVVGVARLLMLLSLFALYEQIVKSTRMASIATMIYMANPHFLLFDSQYGYESLALPLAAFVMFAMAPYQLVSTRLKRLKPMAPFVMFAKERHKGLNNDLRWITFTGWITLIALAFTHHVTGFFSDGLLISWAIAYALMCLVPMRQSNLVKTAIFAVIVSLVSIYRPGNPVVGYLSSFIGESLSELSRVITGTGSARQLFVTYAGQPTPLWERAVTLSSLGLIVLALPFGLLCLWQRYRSNALTCTFGAIALFYPISQVFRFTNTGSELTDRAAPFLFIPISAVLAILITQFWPARQMNWKGTTLLTAALSIVFLGGTILGSGPSSALLPGPYEVIADARSIEPEGIQAAMWAGSYLGDNKRMATDRINQILMSTYGNERIVSTIEDKIDLSPVFLSTQLGPKEISLLKSGNVRYLVVDLRLAQSLPLLGFYYEQYEAGAFNHATPIPPNALTKFNAIQQINRVFDSGDIVIYDVKGLLNAPETS